MIHKILPYGAHGNPFTYLLGHGRQIEAEVRCPQKYTSGVLSLSEVLTPERARKIIAAYEGVACAGRQEACASGWAMHRENGRTELHLT